MMSERRAARIILSARGIYQEVEDFRKEADEAALDAPDYANQLRARAEDLEKTAENFVVKGRAELAAYRKY